MKKTCLRFTAVLAAVLMAVSLLAQEYKVEVKTDKEDAIYNKSQKITFSAQVLMDGKPVAGQKINYLLQGDGNLRKSDSFVSAEKPFTLGESLWIFRVGFKSNSRLSVMMERR